MSTESRSTGSASGKDRAMGARAGGLRWKRLGRGVRRRRNRPLRLDLDDRDSCRRSAGSASASVLIELLAPRAVGRAIGVGDHPVVTRMVGVREIVTRRRSAVGTRAALVGVVARRGRCDGPRAARCSAARSAMRRPQRIAIAAASVLGVAALDVYAGQRLAEQSQEPPDVRVSESSPSMRRRSALRVLAQLENLPRFMQPPEIRVDDERAHISLDRERAGRRVVEWDSEIVDDQPGARIGWRTLPDSEISTKASSRSSRRRRAWHDRACGDDLLAAGRQGRHADRAAVRRRAERADPRRSAPPEAVASKPARSRRRRASRRAALAHRSRDARGEVAMRAVCWQRSRRSRRREACRIRRILNPRDAIVKVTATAICGSDLHLYDGYIPTMYRGDILGHEFMGEVVEVGARRRQSRGRRSRGRAVSDRLRQLFLLRARDVFAVRELESERACCGESLGTFAGRHLRLFAHARRLRRRAGGVRARAVRRHRSAQGSRLARRRAGAVPLRHPADRLHGRRELRHPGRRHGCGLGLRSGRPVRHPERAAAGRRARDRDRPISRAPAQGARRRRGNAELRIDGRAGRAERR